MSFAAAAKKDAVAPVVQTANAENANKIRGVLMQRDPRQVPGDSKRDPGIDPGGKDPEKDPSQKQKDTPENPASKEKK